jgi:hypothetical protein
LPADLNEAIEELLERLNNRRFRKRDGVLTAKYWALPAVG